VGLGLDSAGFRQKPKLTMSFATSRVQLSHSLCDKLLELTPKL
jgi:hypothetical protein